jgi:hypothetical protein
VREQLAVAHTNEKHLLTRVEELNRQLEKSVAKLGVYETRPQVPIALDSAPRSEPADVSALERQLAELR